MPRSFGPRAHDCVWWQAAVRSTRPHLRRGRRVPRTASRSCFAHGTRISPTATPVLVCAELAHAPDPVLARFLLTLEAKQKSAASRAGSRFGTNASISRRDWLATAHPGKGPPRPRGRSRREAATSIVLTMAVSALAGASVPSAPTSAQRLLALMLSHRQGAPAGRMLCDDCERSMFASAMTPPSVAIGLRPPSALLSSQRTGAVRATLATATLAPPPRARLRGPR